MVPSLFRRHFVVHVLQKVGESLPKPDTVEPFYESCLRSDFDSRVCMWGGFVIQDGVFQGVK
jgi:hypothetical protein